MKHIITQSGTLALHTLTSFWNAPFRSGRFRKEVEETVRYAQRLITAPISAVHPSAHSVLDDEHSDDCGADSDVEFWELRGCSNADGTTRRARGDEDFIELSSGSVY